MTRSVAHGSFCIERRFAASPARVFRAFSDPKAKAIWFGPPPEMDWVKEEQTLDFRVGGKETSVGGPKGGPRINFEATFLEIVPNERIITAYMMDFDGKNISASLTTTELHADGDGTRLVFTEQDAFLDGFEDGGGREHGTAAMLDVLGRALASGAI